MKKLRRNQYISRSTKDSFFVDEKKKRPIIPLIIVGVILAAVFAFFIYGLRYGGKVVIARATVESSQLPKSFDGYKILQISDVYGKEFGERQKKLRDMLKDEDYDIVIFTGDYMGNDTDPDFWVIRDIIEGLKEDVPIYYVLGENDYTPANASETSEKWKMCIVPPRKLEIMSLFEEYGGMFVYPAQIVTNASGDSIYLTGISYDREALNAMDFDQDVDFSICVTHKPINYNVSRRLKDVNKRTLTEVDYDLSLSGHTFGGQYRLPVLGAIFSDEEGWFPQEKSLRGISRDDAGRYNYICGGLGVASGFRFFSNPEISIIELKYAEPAKK
ncbi:MAG: metallophosphoesterase [Clostridia bacterium]|nr:metallophosphoesterase [Clostridia bacterium]MBR7077815.1 metallophosphoesterase [Clostridia bacterium]